jgi:peroxiredoxin family protein
MPAPRPPVCVFVQRGEYEALHQAFAIAAAAVAMEGEAEVYLSWWALERLARGAIDEPDLAREDVSDTMEARGLPTIRQLLTTVRESGAARIFACSGSLAALGLDPATLEGKVDAVIGWSAILARTRGIADRFHL